MDQSKFRDKKEWRKFGFGFSLILVLMGTIQMFRGHSLALYFYGFSILFGFLTFVFPLAIKPWMIFFTYLGRGIGWFTTRLILCFVFYFLITPLAMGFRFFGKKIMPMQPDSSLDTYWIRREKEFKEKTVFENQY